MFMKKFGMVAIMLATVCCGALLAGCADGSEDEDGRSDWVYSFDPANYEWIEVTSDNMNDLVGLWSCEAENKENKVYWKQEISVKIDGNSFIYTYIVTQDCKNSPDDVYESLKKNTDDEFTEFNDNLRIIKTTKEELRLEELYEELGMDEDEKMYISTTKDRLKLSSGQPFAKER